MLRENISDALKDAMKAQDKMRLSTLRLVNAAIKDRDIANRGEGKSAADEGDIQSILARMIKQREESARMFEEGGRQELADGERAEIEIIRGFLPKQLDATEVQAAIDVALKETQAEGLRDMGKVMAHLKERYTGTMDFSAASALIREKLK